MTRTIAGATQTAIDSDTGVSVYLIRLQYGDGLGGITDTRFTNATGTLNLDVGDGSGAQDFLGTGFIINVSEVTESGDLDADGMDITFDGVGQEIISIIMGNHFRGHKSWIYKAWYDTGAGTVLGSPVLLFDGYQNERYTIGETSTDLPDVVQVSTRMVSRVTRVGDEKIVVSNVTSHNELLERGGITPVNPDGFWRWVPSLMNKEVVWGNRPISSVPYSGGYLGRDVTPGPGGPTTGFDGRHY